MLFTGLVQGCGYHCYHNNVYYFCLCTSRNYENPFGKWCELGWSVLTPTILLSNSFTTKENWVIILPPKSGYCSL